MTIERRIERNKVKSIKVNGKLPMKWLQSSLFNSTNIYAVAAMYQVLETGAIDAAVSALKVFRSGRQGESQCK